MSINTFLPGRLRNTNLPFKEGLLPLYEAVVNSIHAIEDSGISTNRGKITIEIERGGVNLELELDKKRPGPEPQGPISGFRIRDNGVGFTDINMDAFKTLDTDNKKSRGGRGVGRLLWLKAFDHVRIKSTFLSNSGEIMLREFTFDPISGVSGEKIFPCKQECTCSTEVALEGFKEKYRVSIYKTTDAIARALLEHCIWFFLRPGGAPEIYITDENLVLSLDELYQESMFENAKSSTPFMIREHEFEILHVKLRANSTTSHQIAYCADSRVVELVKLPGKIPGLFGHLSDDDQEFTYSGFVSSPFLDENVRSERTSIDIPDTVGELFEGSETSWKEIEQAVCDRVAEYLAPYLSEVKKKSKERVDSYVSNTAPRYRPIVARIPVEQLDIDPDISDKDLELTLHRQYAEMEQQLLADGHDLLNPYEDEEGDEYCKRLSAYLERADDIKKSDLAGYVSHRRVILDLFEHALKIDKDGKYRREDVLHTLIMPMRRSSNDTLFDTCNLWLIDERLAFHDYLASDKPLSSMPITGNEENKEPDLIALNVFDNPTLVSEGSSTPSASIVIVEVKRPMRDDAESGEKKDPIEQTLGYLDRVRQGQVLTSSGRPIPNCERIPGYCYIVCDLTSSIAHRCRYHGMTYRSDGLGYFKYNPPMEAYIEVISYDGMVKAAKERNRAFFDKLGLPAK